MPPPMRSPDEAALINAQPYGVLIEFRDSVFAPAYVASNPDKFLGVDWIDIEELQKFLARTGRVSIPQPGVVKTEPSPPLLPPAPQIGRVILENGNEVIDICSDSDNDGLIADQDVPSSAPNSSPVIAGGRSRSVAIEDMVDEEEIAEQARPTLPKSSRYIFEESAPDLSSPCPPPSNRAKKASTLNLPTLRLPKRVTAEQVDEPCDSDTDGEFLPPDARHILENVIRAPDGHRSPAAFNSVDGWRVSETDWAQAGFKSFILDEEFQVTRNRTVQRVEYLFGLPPYFPIPDPSTDTAFVVDLDSSSYDFVEANGERYTIDALIKNHDNDSWKGTTGSADTNVWVNFPGGERHLCRRSRLRCKGGFACRFVDPEFVKVDRRYFDATVAQKVFSTQRCAQAMAGSTEEHRVAEAVTAIRSKKCSAVDKHGNICTGIPILRENRGEFGGKWRVDCSGRTTAFDSGHLVHPINVNQDLFIRAFHAMPMSHDRSRDTKPCGRIVHPTTGNKGQKSFAHTHIIDGISLDAQVVAYPCKAERTIFVPVDPSVRKAMLLHLAVRPHEHLLPAFTKKTISATTLYEDCVVAAGTTAATPAKVDAAPSTTLLLNGKTPAQAAPALQSRVLKNKIVRDVKKKAHPHGLGIEGALHLYRQDGDRDLEDRYVQRFVTLGSEGTIILTAVPGLLKLLDDESVNSFEADTTFKRVCGDMNELELVTFFKPLNRALTIARAYVDRASADFFERVFDEINSFKRELTGKPISFKALMGGNIIAFNSDMESAQVLGATRSFLKTNVESHSGIRSDITPQAAAPFLVKLCMVHFKRGILDFKSLVSPSDFARLLHAAEAIKSPETLAAFSDFIRNLQIKRIQDWWDHKEMSDWILPCLVKSLSPIDADDWDATPSTTNTGEAQHHWTNQQTGTKLALVEAIESARAVDLRAWSEVEFAVNTGIMMNPYNGATQRLARTLTRHATAIRKYQEAEQRAVAATELDDELETAKQEQKAAAERVKELKAQKSAGKTLGKKSKKLAGDSSSGRVKSKLKAPSIALQNTNSDLGIAPALTVTHGQAPTPALVLPDMFFTTPTPALQPPQQLPNAMPALESDYGALPFMYNNDTFDLVQYDADAGPFPAGSGFEQQAQLDDATYAQLLASVLAAENHHDSHPGGAVGEGGAEAPWMPFVDAVQKDSNYYLLPSRPSPSPPPMEEYLAKAPPSRKRKAEVDLSLILSPNATRQRRKPVRADANA